MKPDYLLSFEELLNYTLAAERLGVAPHPELDRFRARAAELDQLISIPTAIPTVIDADLEQLVTAAIVGSLPAGAFATAVYRHKQTLAVELRDVLKVDAERTVTELRPAFDAAATEVTRAADLGIEPGMKPADVIDMKPAAITAYRAFAGHYEVLSRIAKLRILMSELLGLAPHEPTLAEQAGAAWGVGIHVDYAPAFTDPASGVVTGYRDSADAWLGLAIATGGRLRLNGDDVTQRIALPASA